MPQDEFNTNEKEILDYWKSNHNNIWSDRNKKETIHKANMLAMSYINHRSNRALDRNLPADQRIFLDCYKFYTPDKVNEVSQERFLELFKLSAHLNSNFRNKSGSVEEIGNLLGIFKSYNKIEDHGIGEKISKSIAKELATYDGYTSPAIKTYIQSITNNKQTNDDVALNFIKEITHHNELNTYLDHETKQLISDYASEKLQQKLLSQFAEEAKTYFNGLSQELNKNSDLSKQILNIYKDTQKVQLEEANKLAEYKRFTAKLKDIGETFTLVSSVVRLCGSPKIANKISVVGDNAIKIYSAVNSIMTNTIDGFALGPHIAIANGILGIFSAFQDGGNAGMMSALQGISKQIQALHKDLMKMRQEMIKQFNQVFKQFRLVNERLDHIEKSLDRIYNFMYSAVESLKNGQYEILNELQKLQINIDQIDKGIHSLGDKIDKTHDSLMHVLQTANAEDILAKIKEIKINIDNPSKLNEKYKDYLNKLVTISTIRSTENLLVNSNNNDPDFNVGFLYSLLPQTLQDRILSVDIIQSSESQDQRSSHLIKTKAVLPNPKVWLLSTNTLIHLINTLEKQRIALDDNDLNTLALVLKKGEIFLQFITALSDKTLLLQLQDMYVNSYDSLVSEINSHLKQFLIKFQADNINKQFTSRIENDIQAMRQVSISSFNPKYYHGTKYIHNEDTHYVVQENENNFRDYKFSSTKALTEYKDQIANNNLLDAYVDLNLSSNLPIIKNKHSGPCIFVPRNNANTSLLLFYQSGFELPSWVKMAELLGVGTVEYYYVLENEIVRQPGFKFTICADFVVNKQLNEHYKTIKVNLFKVIYDSASHPNRLYEANAQVWFIWNGGRYAEENDHGGPEHRQRSHESKVHKKLPRTIDATQPNEVDKLIKQQWASIRRTSVQFLLEKINVNSEVNENRLHSAIKDLQNSFRLLNWVLDLSYPAYKKSLQENSFLKAQNTYIRNEIDFKRILENYLIDLIPSDKGYVDINSISSAKQGLLTLFKGLQKHSETNTADYPEVTQAIQILSLKLIGSPSLTNSHLRCENGVCQQPYQQMASTQHNTGRKLFSLDLEMSDQTPQQIALINKANEVELKEIKTQVGQTQTSSASRNSPFYYSPILGIFRTSHKIAEQINHYFVTPLISFIEQQQLNEDQKDTVEDSDANNNYAHFNSSDSSEESRVLDLTQDTSQLVHVYPNGEHTIIQQNGAQPIPVDGKFDVIQGSIKANNALVGRKNDTLDVSKSTKTNLLLPGENSQIILGKGQDSIVILSNRETIKIKNFGIEDTIYVIPSLSIISQSGISFCQNQVINGSDVAVLNFNIGTKIHLEKTQCKYLNPLNTKINQDPDSFIRVLTEVFSAPEIAGVAKSVFSHTLLGLIFVGRKYGRPIIKNIAVPEIEKKIDQIILSAEFQCVEVVAEMVARSTVPTESLILHDFADGFMDEIHKDEDPNKALDNAYQSGISHVLLRNSIWAGKITALKNIIPNTVAGYKEGRENGSITAGVVNATFNFLESAVQLAPGSHIVTSQWPKLRSDSVDVPNTQHNSVKLKN